MIVGITGYARSGKDTLAKSLRLRHGFRRIAFADKLKELALGTDPIIYWDELCDIPVHLSTLVAGLGWDRAKEHPEVRQYLQRLGDGCRIVFGEDVWIRATLPKLHALQDAGHHIVYTDVRYPNEADFIRSKGGLIIKVVRPGVQPANNHVTEKNVDLIQEDILLHNNGSKTDLGRSASEYLSQYLS